MSEMKDVSLQKNDKVTLRAIEPEDLDMLYTIENDVETWNAGTTNVPYSRYILQDYIAHASNDIYVDRQVRFIIQAGGTPVGIADLVDFDPKHLRAEIGIVIKKQFRGQGFAHEVVEQLIAYGKSVIHLHQLYALVDVENKQSLNLFSNLGFCCNGTFKDWLFDGNNYHDALLMQVFL
jgi:diamine N-acetyltransferase